MDEWRPIRPTKEHPLLVEFTYIDGRRGGYIAAEFADKLDDDARVDMMQGVATFIHGYTEFCE